MNDLTAITSDAMWRPSAALNPQRLDYLWSLTERIAFGSNVPETLRGERNGSAFKPFDDRAIMANVFAVVEQADRWNVSPFALLGAAAIVRGKLTFEGKVIAAVLETQFGVMLHTYYRGQPRTDSYHIYLCDEELPEDVLAKLEPGFRSDRYKIMDGSVATWKTTGNGSPWRPDTYSDMLVYRGTRQWARIYKSAAILGVIADDEVEHLALERAAQAAAPALEGRFSGQSRDGFNAGNVAKQIADARNAPMDIINSKTGEVIERKSGEQAEGTALKSPSQSKGDKPAASAQRSSTDDRGAGSADGNRPHPTSSLSSTGSEQRSSNPQAAGSSPAASASPSGNADGDEVPEGGGAIRNPRDVFLKFSSVLGRMNSADSVRKAKGEFFKDGTIRSGSQVEHELFKAILKAHVDRAEGKLPIEPVLKDITSWIESDIPEDKL